MNYCIVWAIVVVCCAQQIVSDDNAKVTAFKQMKAKLMSSEYDKEIRPNLGENYTEVSVTLHIFDLKFDEKDKKVKFDVYFRQHWNDPRLANPEITESVVGGQLLADRIWQPDTFFPSASVKCVTEPRPNIFVKIDPNGNVKLSERLEAKNKCRKSGENYVCAIEFESYGFGASDIVYALGKGQQSITVQDNVETVQNYSLIGHKMEESKETLSTGDYSRMTIELTFSAQQPSDVTTIPSESTTDKVRAKDVVKKGSELHEMLGKVKFSLPKLGGN